MALTKKGVFLACIGSVIVLFMLSILHNKSYLNLKASSFLLQNRSFNPRLLKSKNSFHMVQNVNGTLPVRNKGGILNEKDLIEKLASTDLAIRNIGNISSPQIPSYSRPGLLTNKDIKTSKVKVPPKAGLVTAGAVMEHGWNTTSTHTNKTKTNFRDIFNLAYAPHFPIGPDNVSDKDNYFIYRCDEKTMHPCGGLSDRLKGAMYAYIIANLTGRTFKLEILFDSCDTHRFIVPNDVDWYLPSSFHSEISTAGNVSKIDAVDNLKFIDNLNHEFHSMHEMKAKYVYFKVNREPFQLTPKFRNYQKQLRWMRNVPYPDMFNMVFRRLFKPSSYLQKKLNDLFKEHLQPKTKLVCVHLRMGKNPSISMDATTFLAENDLPNVWKFLYNLTLLDDIKIFLMSDSAAAISQAKRLTFGEKFFFSTGRILHIDRSPGVSAKTKCEGYEKIIFEQFILMHCDVLVLSQFSGISRTAAYIRGTDDSLYCVSSSSAKVYPCNRDTLPH